MENKTGGGRVLYVDGGCSGNGQRDLTKRRMVMVVADEQGIILDEKIASGGSNNVAELWATNLALLWCAAHDIFQVEIRTDSQINISWVKRATTGKQPGATINDPVTVRRLFDDVRSLRRRVAATLVWVPREKNIAGHYIERTYGV